ncbi:hypothetical protein [Pseudomonas putida]|uniref:hypothetical protein n=1 Tax=Pseudomonas putida TaxID=303 RepID=UPI003D98D716
MTVKVEMHDGSNYAYDTATRVSQEQYTFTLYDERGNVVAHLNKGDVKNLHTKDPEQSA